jgi:hypothetical protein
VEAAGVEPSKAQTFNWLTAHDFRSKSLIPVVFLPPNQSTGIVTSVRQSTAVLETSLTTSAMSRDTFSVQAAGAGSHKLRVGGGGRVPGARRFRMSTLQRSKSLTASLTVVPTKHLFGHNGTMMTRANSR